MVHGKAKSCRGGQKVNAMKIKDIKDWCEFYGAELKRGFVTLFKAVDKNYLSPHGADYSPGNKPIADDWDGGKRECGNGLHFSPSPRHAKLFYNDAQRFVGCRIKADEIAIHPDGWYPEKVKARMVSKPCYEVDINGNRISR